MTIQVKKLNIEWNRRVTPEEDLPLGKYPSDDLNQGRLRAYIAFEYNNKRYSFEVMNPEIKEKQIRKEIQEYIELSKPLKNCRDISPKPITEQVEEL